MDAAKLGSIDAERTVTLLDNIDLENATVFLDSGSIILNLNGKTVTSAAARTMTLTGGVCSIITKKNMMHDMIHPLHLPYDAL